MSRKWAIRLLTFLGGLYFFLKFVLPEYIGGVSDPENPEAMIGGFKFSRYHDEISNGFLLIGGMTFAIGLINLLMVHGTKVVFRRKGSFASASLLLGLLAMMSISLMDWLSTRELSDKVNRVLILREFALRIESDAKQGITPTNARGESLNPVARTKILKDKLGELLPALDSEISSLEAEVGTAYAGELPPAFSKAKSDYVSARTALDESIAQVPQESDLGVVGLSSLLAIAQRLGETSVGLRALYNVHYGLSLTKRLYELLFQGFFVSLGAAMFSLLGFYIAAAAYRAFRIRSFESVLMMTAALVVMLGQIPFGFWLSTVIPGLDIPHARLWLLQVPSAAAARAIEIGASLAGLIMAFRMWFSIESESFK